MTKFLIYCSILVTFFLSACVTEYNSATGRQNITFISTDREVRLGESLSRRIEEIYKLTDDFELSLKIETIGQRIANVSERQDIVYHFRVLDKDEPNAFALPGGFIYINKGLIDILDNDDQIACVLAHEIAHVVARHSIYRLQQRLGYEALLIIASRSSDSPKTRNRAIRAINKLFLSYSREDELEADRLAIKYVQDAGYDPTQMIKVLEKLREIKRDRPIRRLHLRTHPYIQDRIGAIRKELFGRIEFVDYMSKPP